MPSEKGSLQNFISDEACFMCRASIVCYDGWEGGIA